MAQRLTPHQRHDVKQHSASAPGIVERKDVRMLKVGGNLNFLQESLCAEGLGKLRAQNLECDLAMVPEVVRKEDRSHSSFADTPLDPILVGERGCKCVELGRFLCHRGASRKGTVTEKIRRRGEPCHLGMRISLPPTAAGGTPRRKSEKHLRRSSAPQSLASTGRTMSLMRYLA